MKKYILFLLSFYISVSAFAQKPIPYISLPAQTNAFFKKNHNWSGKKADTSEWYTPFQYMLNIPVIGDSLKPAIGFLQHDSLAKLVYADGTTAYNTWLSVGGILDPKDSMIGTFPNTGTVLNNYMSYRLDSIRFTYVYVRNTDSLPDGSGGQFAVTDTLFISYFKGNQIQQYSFDNTENKYALVGWRGDSVRMSTNAFQTDVFLLSRTDSTGVANTDGKFENYFNTKVFSVKAPAGLTVDANGGNNPDNLIGYTFTFKSGIPTVVGTDTAIMLYQQDPSTLPPGSRRTNYFGFLYAISDTMRVNPTYYNTSLLAPALTSYQPYNGWNGYVPGNGFTKEYFIDADFYLSYDNASVGVQELTDGILLENIFPNPASSWNHPNMALYVKHPSTVCVTLYNMIGQCVKTLYDPSLLTTGEHTLELNTSELEAGIYMVRVTVNGVSSSQKLIIAH